MTLAPVRLLPSFREKIWGSTDLEPWFRGDREKIGEVWFTHDDAATICGPTLRDLMREHGPALTGRDWHSSEFPILVKFIFTSERLSIQVHPDDEQARQWEQSRGKTEMWHILRADPDAAIALGLEERLSREKLRDASLSGEILDLVRWFPVQPGDTYFTPPGTVHAIGPGVALCEIQQNSDITYRLYDYGRGRELHLEKGIAAFNPEPHPGASVPVELGAGRRLLAECAHFRTEAWELTGPERYRADPGHADVLVFLEGGGTILGRPFSAGEVWIVPACSAPFELAPRSGARLLRTFVPSAGTGP